VDREEGQEDADGGLSPARTVLASLRHALCLAVSSTHRASTVTGQQAQSQASKHSHRPASTVTGQQAQSQASKHSHRPASKRLLARGVLLAKGLGASGKGCASSASGHGRSSGQELAGFEANGRHERRDMRHAARDNRRRDSRRHATRRTRQAAPHRTCHACRASPHAVRGQSQSSCKRPRLHYRLLTLCPGAYGPCAPRSTRVGPAGE
jgi:hypothetical protein